MSYIFIDESGVHKQDGVSTIALVYISVVNILKIDQAVLSIEQKLDIETFHWSHSTWGVRKKFTKEISKEKFSAKIALIKNPFYESVSYEHALQNLIAERNISALIIDGKKSKLYERKIKKILRDKGISIKKIRTANDTAYPALRIADLVAGIARNKHDNPNERKISELYQLISPKISLVLE